MNEDEVKRIADFKMPNATVGTPVVWYRYGRRRSQDAQVGYMLHCGGRTTTIFLATGRRIDAVRHVDDPKLDLSVDQREQGAWDFTDDWKDAVRDRKEVSARLTKIERQINALITGAKIEPPPKKKMGNPVASKNLSEFRTLQSECKKLGIPTFGKKAIELRGDLARHRIELERDLNADSVEESGVVEETIGPVEVN